MHAAIGDRGAEVVAVSAEPLETAKDAAKEATLPFPVLSDAALTVIERYGLRHVDEPKGRRIAMPAVFVLDGRGIVRFAHVGEHPRDRPTIGVILLALESLN